MKETAPTWRQSVRIVSQSAASEIALNICVHPCLSVVQLHGYERTRPQTDLSHGNRVFNHGWTRMNTDEDRNWLADASSEFRVFRVFSGDHSE